jgi:hypothetical protein
MPVEDEKKFTRGGNQAASQRFQSSALEIEVLSATAPEDHEYTGDPKHCHPCALRAFVNAELRARAVERELNQWRTWAQWVYLGGGLVTLGDDALRMAVNETHDREMGRATKGDKE